MDIEKLPEDILFRILQSPSLVDTVGARSVSRTWKNLWEKSCSQNFNLCFNVDNLVGVDMPVPEDEKYSAPDLTYYRKGLTLKNGYYTGMSSQIIEDFVKGVDLIVQCRRGEEQDGVRSLEIRFPLWGKHSYHVDNWISSTVTSDTKQLILVFDLPSNPQSSHIESDFYKFPFEALQNQKKLSLEYLQLEFVSTKLPQNFDGFTSLRTLKLNCPDLTQEDVHKLLITCPLLEFLKIRGCRNLVTLQVSSPLPQLKVLVLQKCEKLRRMELWAENLSSFDCDTAVSIDHFVLRGSNNLTKVAARCLYNIDAKYFRPLSNEFSSVSTLFLDTRMRDLSALFSDIIFARLKFLALFLGVKVYEEDFLYLLSLLNLVAPILEELELHVLNISESAKGAEIDNQRINSDSYYYHLKRVVLTGFTGATGQTMLAKYFLMKPRLEIMTIDPVVRHYENFAAIEPMGCRREIDERCRKAYELLCEEVPGNTKLILVGNN